MPRYTVDVKALINLVVEADDEAAARVVASAYVEEGLSPTAAEVEGYRSALEGENVVGLPVAGDYGWSVDGESDVELVDEGGSVMADKQDAAPPAESYRIACISTGHLEKHTADLMEKSPDTFGFIVAPFEEGFFVSCQHVPPACDDSHFSLWLCRYWAKENGYAYLMLDRDAELLEKLPYYEWESKRARNSG